MFGSYLNLARPLRRGLAANSTDTTFATKVPVVARPSNDGVIDLSQEGDAVPGWVKVFAVGVGANNDAFSVRIYGWSRVIAADATKNIWIPQIIGELAFIMGQKAGLLSTVVPSTELFADTVTIVSEPTTTAATTRDGKIVTYSPANDTLAFAVVPVWGFELIEFNFDNTTNTPTMNVLYSPL